MKKQRVIIVYELFKRENINVSILKAELLRRGYDAIVLHKTEQFSLLKKSDILIVPNSYCTEDYEYYRYRFNCPSGKMINLQVEQIFIKKGEENLSDLSQGRAKDMITVCWGENKKRDQIRNGMMESYLPVVGNMALDSIKPKFDSIWMSREELAKEYNIPDLKWNLFISSFSYTKKDSAFFNNVLEQVGYDAQKVRIEVEIKTQPLILDMFKEYIEKKDEVIIYRPHPNELKSDILEDLRKTYPNRFFVIPDYNIKQWIRVCDRITMWDSTSIVECFGLGKSVGLIRPIDIPEYYDYVMFNHAKKIRNCDDLIDFVNTKEKVFPVDKELLKSYVDVDVPYAYINICDIVDSLSREEDKPEEHFNSNRLKYYISWHVLSKTLLKKIYQKLNLWFGFSLKDAKWASKLFISEWEYFEREKKEFKVLNDKIGKCINN